PVHPEILSNTYRRHAAWSHKSDCREILSPVVVGVSGFGCGGRAEDLPSGRNSYGTPARSAMAPDRLSIQPYSHTTAPTNAAAPSHGAGPNVAGTIAIGVSVVRPTMRPAFTTPHTLSPTMSPDATSVP